MADPKSLHPRIEFLINDHFARKGRDDPEARAFLREVGHEFHMAALAEAAELLPPGFGATTRSSRLEIYIAGIAFLQAFYAFDLHRVGLDWRRARTMSS